MGYQSQRALWNDLTQPVSRGVLLKVLFSFGKLKQDGPQGSWVPVSHLLQLEEN